MLRLISLLIAISCVTALGQGIPSAPMSADTTARLIAGLSVDPAAVGGHLQSDPELVRHTAELNRTWERMDGGRLTRVREWSREQIQPRIKRPRTVFYMFGGPDFLWVANAFPMADTYILAGLEPIGEVPDLRTIPPDLYTQSLAEFRHSMRSILDKGFYETKEMREDLARGSIRGVMPALYAFVVRTGHRILDVNYIKLDAGGSPGVSNMEGADGVDIRFTSAASGATQHLYYFKTDLSDGGIKNDPRFLTFLGRQGQGSSYLKAASYLMHEAGFERIKTFLLANSQCILQDDSGIPFRYFDARDWTTTLFGSYRGPVPIFAKHFQSDLQAAFQGASAPLPFGTGYRVSDADSNQILAVRH